MSGNQKAESESWEEFSAGLRSLGLALSPEQLAQLRAYVGLLLEWGQALNLIGAATEREILFLHVLDSLLAAPFLDRHLDGWPRLQALDVGTGGGLPGIPLAIAFPELRVTLLESSRKKTAFLAQAARRLALAGVEIAEARAETIGHQDAHREAYGLVVARALAPLPVLAELALPFLRLQGALLAYKGPGWREELEQARPALQLTGGELTDAEESLLPGFRRRRALLLLRKVSPTPPHYPRRPGVPAKRPL